MYLRGNDVPGPGSVLVVFNIQGSGGGRGLDAPTATRRYGLRCGDVVKKVIVHCYRGVSWGKTVKD